VSDLYELGDTWGLSRALYSPDADSDGPRPWCRFGKGLECLNGDQCLNPDHRKPQPQETS